jgi:hypothetical protein
MYTADHPAHPGSRSEDMNDDDSITWAVRYVSVYYVSDSISWLVFCSSFVRCCYIHGYFLAWESLEVEGRSHLLTRAGN